MQPKAVFVLDQDNHVGFMDNDGCFKVRNMDIAEQYSVALTDCMNKLHDLMIQAIEDTNKNSV